MHARVVPSSSVRPSRLVRARPTRGRVASPRPSSPQAIAIAIAISDFSRRRHNAARFGLDGFRRLLETNNAAAAAAAAALPLSLPSSSFAAANTLLLFFPAAFAAPAEAVRGASAPRGRAPASPTAVGVFGPVPARCSLFDGV